jgi:type VI secretion system secreted protein VgrG
VTAAIIDTERNIWVTTPLPDGKLVLESFSGHENLGTPFAYDLSLASRDPAIDLSQLLGQVMTVHVALAAGERQFNGIVVHAENAATDGDLTRYRVTLASWFSLLQHTSNCRIFQGKTVVEIVTTIFRDNNFSDFETSLNETYQPYEYCVQYRESDINFVSRLLESEGIYYYFTHADGKHTLVLADGYSAHKPADGCAEVPYKPQQDDIQDEAERIESWVVSQQLRSGSYAATDFDFTKPRANLLSTLKSRSTTWPARSPCTTTRGSS